MGERLLVRVLGVDESAEAEEWALREGMKLGGGAAGGPGRNGLAPVGEFGETASVNSGAGGGFGSAAGGSCLDRDDAASTVSGATGVERSRTMCASRVSCLSASSRTFAIADSHRYSSPWQRSPSRRPSPPANDRRLSLDERIQVRSRRQTLLLPRRFQSARPLLLDPQLSEIRLLLDSKRCAARPATGDGGAKGDGRKRVE